MFKSKSFGRLLLESSKRTKVLQVIVVIEVVVVGVTTEKYRRGIQITKNILGCTEVTFETEDEFTFDQLYRVT